MIDRRKIKLFNHDIEDDLNHVSDTEILINFNNALTSLYPYLIPINAFAYDAWDDIVIPLFYEMVYQSFSYKYGITLTPEDVHAYEFTLSSYHGKCHIECIPIKDSLAVFNNFEWVNISKVHFEGALLIFKSFGDGINFLTGGIKKEETAKVHFNYVEIEIVSEVTGSKRESEFETIYIDAKDLKFEFIADD
ncbi:hypothetical protein [Paenibacillus sp. NEAU-GSW1]|uniref:hypothetical protein n=1 Tax=Paenibacillus sp. NEAU-GSW1 TaxID=2682486 RepID=UPI0012E16F39|nr:hypothetical protein [Paenibacillus sp. NEAU-GSW1]MUT68327.1 hypothetical protein [Paenibacillus sp. NEAU-GSW1]